MTRNNNIFHNLVKNETSVTELFCNLMRFKPLRVLFLNIVKEKGADIDLEKIDYDCFETEVVLQDDEKKRGRADIIIEIDENNKYIFEIKIERWCGLTESQPVSYLDYLNRDDKRLFFILPEGYYNISEICKRWNSHNSYSFENIKQNNIIYWEQIIKRIKDAELDKLNPFIKEFVEIMDENWFYYEDIVFTQEEIRLLDSKNLEEYHLMTNSNVPKLMNKIFKVIEGVNLACNSKKESVEQNSDYYGYWIKKSSYGLDDDIEVWFGVQYIVWEKRDCPIVIEVLPSSEENNKKFIEKVQSIIPEARLYEDEDFGEICYIPFDLKKHTGDTEENLSKRLEEEIMNVVEKLKDVKVFS